MLLQNGQTFIINEVARVIFIVLKLLLLLALLDSCIIMAIRVLLKYEYKISGCKNEVGQNVLSRLLGCTFCAISVCFREKCRDIFTYTIYFLEDILQDERNSKAILLSQAICCDEFK